MSLAIVKKGCEDLVDIIERHMTLMELHNEIYDLFLSTSPEYCVIILEKDKYKMKYKAGIYVPSNEDILY